MATDRAQRRQQLATFEKQATRIAVGLVIAAFPLGLIAGMLGAAGVYPDDYMTPVALTAMLVPIGLALLLGAMGGLYIMGGWKVTPFGILFVGGFAALVYGIAVPDMLWRLAGVGMLAVSGAAFFVAGMSSGRAPTKPWAAVSTVVGGALAAVIGYLLDYWWVLLFGGMAVGCGAGILIGLWRAARRQDS